MALVGRIACFITCGYTEAGGMQAFLKRINNQYEYKQYLPNKTIKKKGMPKNISRDISGLTGNAFLEKIYSILELRKNEIKQCKAILIEDDLDGRFHGLTLQEKETYHSQITEKVHAKLGINLPVFMLYASPEAEGWFIADWKNGFKYLYLKGIPIDDVEIHAKQFFVHHLREYINQNVLKQYSDDIENYGYFDNQYFKLSDQLIDAIQSGVKEYISSMQGTNPGIVKQIVESRNLYYSKKLHGDKMLKNIDPRIVAQQCRNYFSPVYYEIKEFTS